MDKPAEQGQQIQAHLSLWDAVSIIIGIVIGATIFEAPPLILSNVSGPWAGLSVWAFCGGLALIGALCYAELASTYPRSGGDYVFLTRAYGPGMGFLFGWAQLVAIITGSIGAMAYVFARYAVRLWDAGQSVSDQLSEQQQSIAVLLAVAAVAGLSALNIMGVVLGKRTQNALTVAKLLGLAGILVIGFAFAKPRALAVERPMSGPGLGLAMIFVLYAYGGWNDSAFVVAEFRNRRRNIPLALVLGTTAITLIYVGVNLAYMSGLGFEEVRRSKAVAADLLDRALGGAGATAMCVLVMLSALGAINGLIFTGSRVYSALGADYSLFHWLARWHPRLRTPLWSLLAQAIVSLTMILSVGTELGQNMINDLIASLGIHPIPWKNYGGGFGTLVSGTAPVFWLFFLLTGLSLFTLREKDHGIDRPFSVPLYPFLPFIFCLMCAYMLYKSLEYAGALALLGLVPLAAGVPLYLLSRRRARSTEEPVAETVAAQDPVG